MTPIVVDSPPRRPRPEARVARDSVESTRGTYQVHTTRFTVEASTAPQLIDLSTIVADTVTASRIQAGQVNVYCMHTTAALILNEDECLLHEDMATFLEELSSCNRNYRHDDMLIRTENLEPDHGRNGHAHLKQMVLGSTMTLPVVDGRLLLGTWQRLFLLELDRPRQRTVVVQVSGVEAG